MAGWVIIHFFKIGGEWGFVQRYTCVPTAKDAKKAAFIFGAMYLISPLFWMLPPLVFRVLNPNVDVEQAYILSCKLVLPAGMMGLMIAAMASATASAATSQLNVFAGAFTTEVYQRLLKPGASDKQMVQAGRVFTIVLGGVVIAGALLIPRYGYTRFHSRPHNAPDRSAGAANHLGPLFEKDRHQSRLGNNARWFCRRSDRKVRTYRRWLPCRRWLPRTAF